MSSDPPHVAPVPAESDAASARAAEDLDLIRACIAGDEASWARLVQRHERLVHAVLRRLGLPRDIVEDAFQETFVVLLRQLPHLERHAALPQWLATTARRIGLRLARRSPRVAQPPREEPAFVSAADGPDEELRLRVADALTRLDQKCRDLLVALTRGEGASYVHIARQLGMPIGSIGPRRARCLAKLHALVFPGGADR